MDDKAKFYKTNKMKRYEVKLGTACNNNCIFCLNERRDWNKTTEEIMQEILQAKDFGVNTIQFTGGEPTIRKDFFDILRFTKKLGLNIQIQSNGRIFSYLDYTKRVCSLGIESFLISLHAHNECLNYRLTNIKGGFQQTVNGIKNLLEFKQMVSINCVINRENIDFMDKIVEHSLSFCPSNMQLSWCRPQGKAKNDMKLIPRFSEIEKIYCGLRNINYRKAIALLNVPLCFVKEPFLIGNPYVDSVILRENKFENTKEYFIKKKSFCSHCEKCGIKERCEGIFKEYLKFYGDEEFKNKNDVIVALKPRLQSNK